MSFRHGDVVFCEEDNVVVDVTGKNYLTAFKNVEITTGESFFDMAKDLSSVMKTWAIRDFDGIIDIQISMRPEQPTPEWMIMSLFVVGTPKQSM